MADTSRLRQVDDVRWEVPTDFQDGMRVPGRVFASREMMEEIDQGALDQVANVATMPGIVGYSYAMPDIHWGYGFPIGGVAAFDAEEGVVSPGGVGFDINCGVRLIRTDLTVDEVQPRIKDLVHTMFDNVPSGVGTKAKVRLSKSDMEELVTAGAAWTVDHGFGWKEDLAHIEHDGSFPDADPDAVSEKAMQRGAPQVGSLGGGNHFLEVQRVGRVIDEEKADVLGIGDLDQVCVMVHTGSRGFGHQVCTDALKVMERVLKRYDIDLPDDQLACAPTKSKEGETYFRGMACGINYAWANRQMITHWVRESFEQVFGGDHGDAEDMGIRLVYDIAHNIAKEETHTVDGEDRDVVVHRKGATRAFGPGRPELPEDYRDIGQPVFIPGDMGTESYVLTGTQGAMDETFGSTCHGAGRAMSRTQAKKTWWGEDLVDDLEKKGIYVKPASYKVAAEEAPGAYKDVSKVVQTCQDAGLSDIVVQLRPMGVVKG